jgi:acyl-CoA dehydrogenase
MSLAHPSGDSLTYHAPLADMSFALKYGASLLPALEEGFLGDLSMDDIEAVLSEAGRMAAEVLAPLDRTGDRVGASIKDGVVTTAPGWREAYDAWRKGGWNGLASPTEWGGQALPQIVNAACTEMWNGACMAFGVGPLLTMGAIDALNAHGSDVLKRTYLEKLVTGEWMGTMHLTEPQAGSDVGALRTRVHADNGPFQALADCVRLLWPVSGPVRQASSGHEPEPKPETCSGDQF